MVSAWSRATPRGRLDVVAAAITVVYQRLDLISADMLHPVNGNSRLDEFRDRHRTFGEGVSAFIVRMLRRIELSKEKLVVSNHARGYSGRRTASLIEVGAVIGQPITP